MKRYVLALIVTTLCAAPATAEKITIEAVGTVITNEIFADEPLSLVVPGEKVTLTLEVDSQTWDTFYPDFYRAYAVSSFDLEFSGGVQVGLLPAASTAYFSVSDDFYFGNDNFWVSNYFYVEPGKVELAQQPYLFDFQVGYPGDTVDSVDILDALGGYDADSTILFGFRIWDSYFNNPENLVMNIEFEALSIMDGSTAPSFSDGFESGDTTLWSGAVE